MGWLLYGVGVLVWVWSFTRLARSIRFAWASSEITVVDLVFWNSVFDPFSRKSWI